MKSIRWTKVWLNSILPFFRGFWQTYRFGIFQQRSKRTNWNFHRGRPLWNNNIDRRPAWFSFWNQYDLTRPIKQQAGSIDAPPNVFGQIYSVIGPRLFPFVRLHHSWKYGAKLYPIKRTTFYANALYDPELVN